MVAKQATQESGFECALKSAKTIIQRHIENTQSVKDGEDQEVMNMIVDRMVTELGSFVVGERIAEKRNTGKGGWWDGAVCSQQTLRARAVNKLTRPENEIPEIEDVVDSAAYSLMLALRILNDEK